MKERRRERRIGMGLKIRLTANRYNFEYEANSVNISGGGVMLPITRKLPREAQVELEIFLPNDNLPIKTKGRIAWVETLSQRIENNLLIDRIYCGIEFVEFTEISHEDEGKLLNFIHLEMYDK